MENNNDAEVEQWVGERLANLTPDSEFRPNTIWALSRFRSLVARRSRKARFLGWAIAAAMAVVLFLFALPMPRSVAQRYFILRYVALRQAASASDRPQYAGTKLLRPESYREWIYLSSGLGMEYNAAAGGPENFTNVFVPQWAYRGFLATGRWPDKSMFVLEERASQTKGSINKTGHFQRDLKGLAVEVKDEARFANKWAYFSFGGDTKTAEAMTGPTDVCWQCHDENAAVEHTFVQFYPTLKPVALRFGAYRGEVE